MESWNDFCHRCWTYIGKYVIDFVHGIPHMDYITIWNTDSLGVYEEYHEWNSGIFLGLWLFAGIDIWLGVTDSVTLMSLRVTCQFQVSTYSLFKIPSREGGRFFLWKTKIQNSPVLFQSIIVYKHRSCLIIKSLMENFYLSNLVFQKFIFIKYMEVNCHINPFSLLEFLWVTFCFI